MDILQDKKARAVICVYGVVLFVFMLAFLVIPFPKPASSWISFIFAVTAILFNLYTCWLAFKKCKTVMSAVYAYPVLHIGWIYAAAQLALSVIFCVIGCFVAVPYWAALILAVIMLGAAAVGVIVTDNARDVVEEVEEQEHKTTRTVSQFQISISAIINACKDDAIKGELQNLRTAFLYSDPVSNPATTAIEEKIESELQELKVLVSVGIAEKILEKATQIRELLNERNDLCKANKYAEN